MLKFEVALLVVAASTLTLLGSHGVAASEEQSTRPVNTYSGDAEAAKQGASLFNQYCSHCHGPWAEQGERPRDLRRLHIRYGDDAISVFYTTVNNGRLDKGMPVWKGVLSDQVLWKIYTFLETVQVEE